MFGGIITFLRLNILDMIIYNISLLYTLMYVLGMSTIFLWHNIGYINYTKHNLLL